MSQSVDQRIVSMKFDNAQFEREARTSIETLDKLKDSLNVEQSSSAFNKLKDSMASLPVATVAQGVEEIQLKFSALGIAAAAVIADLAVNLTHKLGRAIQNTLGLIYSGGLNRALNLEQARFSMNGLLYATEETVDGVMQQIERYGFGVEDVMKEGGPVQNAVKDTAYGLDEAAKAASNFIASGVTDLGELESVLKSISGTAAQTGSSYEDIAHVYTRIAGNNRVYAIDLQSFAARGVNAAAALRDYLNKVGETSNATEADIREMVSQGKIDLMTFSKAMYDAFGENAFRANETYTGSLSNLKAALSRLGAKFESKKLENMRDIFNALRPTVDALSKLLDPLINAMTDLNTEVAKFAIGKIEKIQKYFQSFTKGEVRAEKYLKVFDDLSEGLSDVDKAMQKGILEDKAITPIERLANAFKNLVAGIKNVGTGLKVIIDPIRNVSDGFINGYKEGRSFAGIIENISAKILNLTEKFKKLTISDSFKNVLVYLASAASAVWNVFDVLYKTVVNLAIALKNVLGPVITTLAWTFSLLTKPLLELITNFGEIIRENRLVELSFKKLTDILNGTLRPVLDWLWATFLSDGEPTSLLRLYDVVDWLTEGFAKLAIKAKNFLEGESDYSKIGETLVSVFEKIKNVLSPVAEGFDKVKDSISNFFKKILSNQDGVDAFGTVTGIFEKLGSGLGKAASAISSALEKIGTAFKETFTGFNSTSAAGGIVLFGAGGIIYKIFEFIQALAENQGLGVFETILRNLEFASLKLIGVFRTLQESFQVKTIKEISTAILIFAAAIAILSMIDPARLVSATAAVSVAMGELVFAFTTLSAFVSGGTGAFDYKNKMGKGMIQVGAALITMSAAILLLSAAMKSLSQLNWAEIAKGSVALGVLFSLLIGYVYAIENIAGNSNSIVKGSATLIGLALAIDLLVIAVKKLGEMEWEQLIQGLTAVGGILIGLIVFSNFVKADSLGLSSGAGLLLLATAISIIGSVVKKLGNLEYDVVEQGLASIGFALLEIAMFTKMLEGTSPITAAASLMITAVALGSIASAIKKLSGIDPIGLANALMTMAAMLAVIVVALNLLPKDAIWGGAALVLISEAILAIAYALGILSLIPIEKLFNALISMAAALAIMGAAAVILGPIAVPMLAVAAAATIFSVGMLAMASAMAIMTPLLMLFTTGLVGSLKILLDGIVNMAPQIATGVFAMITAIVEGITMAASSITQGIAVILASIIEAIGIVGKQLIETVGGLLISLIAYIRVLFPMFVELGFDMIIAILTGIRDNIEEIVTLGFEIVTNFLKGIENGLPDLVQAAIDLIITWINTVSDAIINNAERFGEAGWNLLKALVLGMALGIKGFTKEPLAKIKELGSNLLTKAKEFINAKAATSMIWNFIKGLIDKIGSTISSVVSKIRELGSKMIAKLKEFISFDKVKQIGKDLIEGLKNGINSLKDSAVEAVKGVGEKIISGIKGLFGIHSPSSVFNEIGVNTIQGLNNGMSSQESASTSTIKGIGNTLLSSIKGIFNKDAMNTVGKDGMSGLSTGMNSQTSSSKTTATSIINQIKQLMNQSEEFDKIGQELINGLVKGIKKKEVAARDQVRSSSKTIANVARQTMEVASPSKLFMRIGEYCMEGLAIGLDDTREAEKNLEALRKTVSEALSGDLTDIGEPVIRPVLDLSEIQNGASRIDGLLSNSGGIIGSVSANIRDGAHNNSVIDAISKLSDRLNQRLDQELSAEEIYSAIQRGVSDANFLVRISGREVTSMVNEINNDSMTSMLEYLGG